MDREVCEHYVLINYPCDKCEEEMSKSEYKRLKAQGVEVIKPSDLHLAGSEIARMRSKIEKLERELVVLQRISDGSVQACEYHNRWSVKYRKAIEDALTQEHWFRCNQILREALK